MIIKRETLLDKIVYIIQFCFLRFLFGFFRIIGLEFSSLLVGVIAMVIGPFTPPSFLAFRNLKKAMPKLSNLQVIHILVGMWNNLGSYIAEYPNVYDKSINIFKYAKVSAESIKNLDEIKQDKRGAILFSGHIGNWEVGLRVLKELGVPVKTVYRPLNNKLADKFTNNFRRKIGVDMIAKGRVGALKIARELKAGTKIVMLVDQRLSNGIIVPFFKRPAQTTDAVGVFALKYGVPIYPVRVIRGKGLGEFEFAVEKEMKVTKGRNFNKSVEKVTKQVNNKLESWIREYPEQWFWVHNRWKM